MNANELRIGNKIYPGFITTVREIHEHYVICDTMGRMHTFRLEMDKCHPLFITEELLTKSGFNQRYTSDPQVEGASQCFFIREFTLHNTNEDDYLGFYFYSHEGLRLKVETMHQLQNLYFALSGQELKV